MLKIQKIHTDKKLEEHLRKISPIRAQVLIGFVDGSTYPDGTSVALVAYKNETGADHIPRRPFMHRTMEKNRMKWIRGICNNLAMRGISYSSVRRAYGLCGEVGAGNMRAEIKAWPWNEPRPNSKKTIEMKRKRTKSRRPGKGAAYNDPRVALIDTGTMLKSVRSEVET